MCSLYLGDIGNGQRTYEIHAFTKDLPFREFKQSEISDKELYRRMLGERFNLLRSGKAIYCTAINPDKTEREEHNPHDDRLGTVHIAALDKKDYDIACVVSVAVDTGEKDHGDIVGLPLENRWRRNGYPEGASLDPFRERYTKLNHGSDTSMKPWQMAELYRHFKVNGKGGDLTSRIGVYSGLYHLGVREARKRGETPTYIWVFDAIPKYFHLYRLAGAAVLRNPTIENPSRHVSPNVRDLEEKTDGNGKKGVFYKGADISRSVKVPIPCEEIGDITFINEDVPFLDGVVDIHNLEMAVKESPLKLSPVEYEGMTEEDMNMLRVAISVLGERHYDDYYGNDQKIISHVAELRKYLANYTKFNEIGKMGKANL